MSPHLDDAVLSGGEFLSSAPDATVVTVFAGMPSDDSLSTDYDRQCGFMSADQAMRTRWQEDQSALSVLGVRLVHLPCLDSQYAPLPDVDTLAGVLEQTLIDLQWDTVIMPMGLFHCDHERVSDACLNVVRRALVRPVQQWILYEDVPYRRRLGVMQRRLMALDGQGWIMAPVALQAGVEPWATTLESKRAKQRALHCYASQLGTLGLSHGGDHEAPERFWSLTLGGL